MSLPVQQRTAKPVFRIVAVILLLLLVIPLSTAAAQQKREVSLENRLKAAYVFNFINFVEWPEEVMGGDAQIDVCVLGFDDVGKAIHSLDGREVMGKTIKVRSLGSPDAIRVCHILYIQTSEKKNVKRVIESLQERPILSIADFDDFSNQGGMITLLLIENKIRFVIDNDSAKRAGLKISSKLLNLAIKVID